MSPGDQLLDYLNVDELVDEKQFCCISVVSPKTKPQCNMTCIMLRGGYSSMDETNQRINLLKNGHNNKCPIWMGQIGYWLPINLDTTRELSHDKQLEILNLQMKKNWMEIIQH